MEFERPTLQQRFRHFIGQPVDFDLRPFRDLVAEVAAMEPEVEALDDEGIRRRADKMRGGDLDEALVEVFALVREASKRRLDQRPYDEQIMAGIALHQGRVAEMQTGEGKTLAAVAPATLNAFMGREVHIHTVNDYLARRDAAWMGPIYEMLGISVGCIQEGMSVADRRAA